MNKAVSSIIETTIRSSKKQTMNVLYHEGSSSVLPAILSHSKKLNFVRSSNITNETLDIDYSAYVCHDYLNMENIYRQIINPIHMKSLVCFNDTPYKMLKKEDLLILQTNLAKSKKLAFCPYVYDTWKPFFEDMVFMTPGIPDLKISELENRKSIVVVSSSNKKQARSLHSQIMDVIKDVGLLVDFNYDIISLMNVFNEYKMAIVLDNSLSCLLAMAANCAVISPIPFYDQVITYNNSETLNQAINAGFEMTENKETISLGDKIRDSHQYDLFDNNLYNFMLNITREPFLL
jgi:hypothetical protein